MTIASPSIAYFHLCLVLAVLLSQPAPQALAADEENELAQASEPVQQSTQAPDPTRSPNATSKAGSPEVNTLPEVSVKSSRIREERVNPTQSITKITAEDLQRMQASSVFDAVRGTPGVNIAGGPRLNGMAFNIRGYTETDVAVSVDGVIKNYDKYRSKGTYIEPDLLKSIEISRGPQISNNSGFLGGAVKTVTKDAEDFLLLGQSVGGRVKFGYGNNNDEYLRSYIAYARPHERIDLLYSYTNRQSNDITQGDGEKLANSQVGTVAELYKFTIIPVDSLRISTSLSKLVQSPTVQLYDTVTASLFTSSPYVLRAIDEETIAQTIHFTPDTPWINLKATLGIGHTKQDETLPFGWIGNSNNAASHCIGYTAYSNSTNLPLSPTISANRCRGDRLDAYNFKNKNFDIANTARVYENKDIRISLLTGLQYFKQERDLERSYGNPASSSVSQEPATGSQVTRSFYIQPEFRYKQLTITPGYRRDFIELQATGETKGMLASENQASKINISEEIFNLGLAFDAVPRHLTLFTNYAQGFRVVPISVLWANSGRDGSRKLQSASSCPADGGSCDSVYKTQRVENTEAGLSYTHPNLFGQAIELHAKGTLFRSHTSNLIQESGLQDSLEIRNGFEFENSLYYRNFYMQAGYSRIDGKIYYFNAKVSNHLYTIPGDTFNLVLGSKLGEHWDINLNYRHVSDRYYSADVPGPTSGVEVQSGYELFNAGLRWAPSKRMNFRLVGENLADKFYNLDGGFAGQLGLAAPGRNIKFYAEFIY
ncbi:TonB-dependent receptor [Methylobacillus gramineus]|uniref:TonB-dependent receptor domain-containing protein n=1 Tax=Methylobacillus gramineus TaxID=755169 RepID=UPI001D000B87|nr:TonB-dependent receptor [Methylobacillus gramineus]MCB5184164.1 TonB-dependent receptor [Methylobacillus gramineus]